MIIDDLIKKYIEMIVESQRLTYEKKEYIDSEKLSKKAFELYVKIISTEDGKTAYKELLKNDNLYVRAVAAIHILNGEDDVEALSVLKELMKEKNDFSKDIKGYYERYMNKELSREYWNEKINKKGNQKPVDSNVENTTDYLSNSSVVDFELPIFPNSKAEAINKFMKQHGEVQTIKDPNPIDEHLSIDINICKFKSGNDYVVYTTGMSNFRMDVPKTLFGKYNKFRYSEVLAFIPQSWGDDFESNNWKPFMTILRDIAVYPHVNGTWVGAGHILEMDLSAFNDEFHSIVLCGLNMVDKNGNKLIVDKEVINIYVVVPIYKEEFDYIHTYGYDNWMKQKLFAQANPFLFTSERKSSLR